MLRATKHRHIMNTTHTKTANNPPKIIIPPFSVLNERRFNRRVYLSRCFATIQILQQFALASIKNK